MRHLVMWNGRKIKVTLPDAVPDGAEFALAVDERSYQATWQRAFSLLVLRDDNGVERHFRVRGRQMTRLDGEMETEVEAEISRGSTVHRLKATVGIDIPGQNHREKANRDQVVRSQITGKVLKVLVKPGDAVAQGQALLTIEAMKMENRVFAALPGKVLSVAVKDGDAVQTGKELLRISP